jgi:hypothetical protein
MNNPETMATLGTQETGRGQIKHKDTTQKTKKDEQNGRHQKLGGGGGKPMCLQRVSNSFFL